MRDAGDCGVAPASTRLAALSSACFGMVMAPDIVSVAATRIVGRRFLLLTDDTRIAVVL